MPFGDHSCTVLDAGHVDAMGTRHAGQHLGSRNIATFLEERIAQAKADGLADPVAVAVSGGCERESRKGGAWEVVGVEVAEKIRSHLRAQFGSGQDRSASGFQGL